MGAHDIYFAQGDDVLSDNFPLEQFHFPKHTPHDCPRFVRILVEQGIFQILCQEDQCLI